MTIDEYVERLDERVPSNREDGMWMFDVHQEKLENK